MPPPCAWNVIANTRAGTVGVMVLILLLTVETVVLTSRDLTKMKDGGSRTVVMRSANHTTDPGSSSDLHAAAAATAIEGGMVRMRDSSAPTLHPAAANFTGPRVALMFLTRGDMPFEPLWRLFLQRLLPGARGDASWRRFFSIYVHPAPGYFFPKGSLFAGREVPERINVTWGQHSVVDAERVLIHAALQEPANQVLVLLSESCVPVYPAALVWTTLVVEQRSRVNACANHSDPGDGKRRMDFRWQEGMAAANITKALWRKSSQWISLVRRHAEAVANDTVVNDVFGKECWISMPWRFCVSDEHYIPTLLAARGMENETACDATLTHSSWPGDVMHPKTYTAERMSPDELRQSLEELRQGCSAEELKQDWRQQLLELLHAPPPAGRGWGGALAAARQRGRLPPPRCPLFARKMDGESAKAWLQLLQGEV